MLEMQRNLYVLRRWWWLLLGAALVGGGVAYGLTKALNQPTYQATAIISMAPPISGGSEQYFSILAASADAQLVSTYSTAQAASRLVSPQVDALKLSKAIVGSPSTEGELLYITVTWPDKALVPQLANAVATAFIGQEQRRIEARYGIIESGLTAQEKHLANLMGLTSGNGSAQNWLQAQYADTASRLYQNAADARIQATTQEKSLQLSQPANQLTVQTTRVKASVNAGLGAILALLIALVIAYVATPSYGRTDEEEASLHPVLANVRD